MDAFGVISISSSTSEDSSESLVSVLTLSSETERVPVSWESGKVSQWRRSAILDLECFSNVTDKVKNWLNTCSPEVEEIAFPECTLNESTCIRYDFEKSTKTTSTAPESCYTRTTPLFSYMEEAKKNACHKNNQTSQRANGSNNHKINVNKDDISTPLSPDSQKKELCNYLQLMKPTEKKPEVFAENRRSNRVKALANEKRSPVNVSVDEDVKCLTLKSAEELKLKNVLNLKRKRPAESLNKFLPLPPKIIYSEITDFEDSVKQFVDEKSETKKNKVNGFLGKVAKGRKFKFKLRQKFSKIPFRAHSLRSKKHLRNISLDRLLLRKSNLKKKARQKMLKKIKEKQVQDAPPNPVKSPKCEIVTVQVNPEDQIMDHVDLKNFVDDMLELDKMSEEHRKSVIESRILASSSITSLITKKLQEKDVQKAYKIFSDLSNERKSLDKESAPRKNNTISPSDKMTADHEYGTSKGPSNNNIEETEDTKNFVALVISEHDYASLGMTNEDEETEEDEDDEDDEGETPNCSSPNEEKQANLDPPTHDSEDNHPVEITLNAVPIPNLKVLPVSQEVRTKSLHRSLVATNNRKLFLNKHGLHNWSSGSNSNRKMSHSISISKKDGAVLRVFYQDYNLVIAQQNLISFWTQSALGNVLGAQNMWIPKGQIQRINLNSKYVQKNATEMVITTETSVAYVELWTKEHKSELREVPVADVFATVYFWRLRQNGLDKKALQLENIKGFADHVQYCVLKYYPKIIVSWHLVQGNEKKTKIHSYHLAADFQTVASISEIQPVQHYVSSLHNIEDCESMVMGCGENKVTLWNVEYGYIVATIEMATIISPLSTLWVKCDRGFLFTIQECVDRELRLIAINGMDHSWKKLQNYSPLPSFDGLKGVCIENGILIAYYSQGILCWNAQSGELIVEEVPNDCEYIPSGKYVIIIVNENIIVRHSLSHLITDYGS